MDELTAQLASARILHLRGRFEPSAPSILLGVKGVGRAYLVPHGTASRQCMVVESIMPISARELHGIVTAIAEQLGCPLGNVTLLRAVERRGAGEKAVSVYDWATLRN